MGKLSPLGVTEAASLLQPETDPDPRLFRHVPSPLPPHTVTLTQGSRGSESLAPRSGRGPWVFRGFGALETGEVGRGSARGRRRGGGEAGDRASRATLAPSVGRDRQLLSNRQRPEIYLKRGKGEENKGGGGGGERSRGESERAGRIRGSAGTSSAHICTLRDRWGEWIIFVSCRPFSSRFLGRGGEGAREGEGRAHQARVRLKDSAFPAAATRKPRAMKARGFFSYYHY